MSSLSTHVLDSATGKPAAGMSVRLEVAESAGWRVLGTGITDSDGRLKSWGEQAVEPGRYRLTFATEAWFAERDRDCFYPEVIIAFTVVDDGHYHVPLLLAPYAYSTYRGS
jgi:5-hydroxyisourate hydrolase